MNHALILPVLLPLFVGSLLLFAARLSMPLKRLASVSATALLVPVSLYLLLQADQVLE